MTLFTCTAFAFLGYWDLKERKMKKLDLKKDLKHLYQPRKRKVEILELPRLHFAIVDGAMEKGYEPGNSPGFQEAIQTLYSVSYTLKFMLKKREYDPPAPGDYKRQIIRDPSKAAPEKLRIVLSHPIEKI